MNLTERIFDAFQKKELKSVLCRVTTWFQYEMNNGTKGQACYRGTVDWDMTGHEDYILTMSMSKVISYLAADKIYPVSITAISKEEFERGCFSNE